MASGTTYQSLERLTNMPERSGEQGDRIAGQFYYDVWFTGGTGENLILLNCTLIPNSGGGGVTTQTIITSGTSGTAHLNGFLGFNSSTNSAKTANIPAPVGTLNIIIIADLKGDAASHAITAVPASGIIIGGSPSSTINTNYGTITLIDTTIGWVSI